MKTKITKLFTYCAIGTSVLLTSCVSEDVSPQVEELRSAQADYLQAQAALEQAKASTEAAQAALLQTQAQIAKAESDAKVAMMEADLAIMQAQAAYQEALTEAKMASEIADLEAAVAEAQYQRDLLEAQLATEKARLQAEMAQAELAAAQARLATQQAVDALSGQINETAQGYLDLYEASMMRASNKTDQINNLKTVVARYEANMDASGNVLNFEQVEAELEAQIAADLAEIEAIEANIARLQGLNANADEAREELNMVENRIDELESALNDANLARDRAYAAFESIDNILSNVQSTVSNIEITQNTIAGYEDYYIPSLNAQIEETMERLEPYQVDLAEVENELSSEVEILQGYLDNAEDAWYALEYASLNGTTEEEQAAQDAYDAAVQEVVDYTGAFYGSPSDAGDYINYYLWAANSGFPFGDAVLAVRDIENYPTYQNLTAEWSNLSMQLKNATDSLNYNKWNLSYWESNLQELLSSVGVDTVDAYYAARSEAIMNYNETWYNVVEIESELSVQWDLRWDLYYYLNDPNRSIADFENQISNYQSQIATLKADIEQNEELLAQNAFEAEEMATMIDRTQERIELLMEEYDALAALADEYLEMFYEIVDNN